MACVRQKILWLQIFFIYGNLLGVNIKTVINPQGKGHQETWIFETRDVLVLTGIPSIYLNKFIEYRSFGIAPSIRKGSGRGSRRLFSIEDVRGIALVWALFRLGLRSKVIGQVLTKARAIPTLEG